MFSFPLHNYHKLGDLHSRNEFSYSFGGWQSKVRVPAWCVLVSLSSWLADDHFLLCLHMVEKNLSWPFLFLEEYQPYRSSAHPAPMTFFSLYHSVHGPYFQIQSYLGLGFQNRNLRSGSGTQFNP